MIGRIEYYRSCLIWSKLVIWFQASFLEFSSSSSSARCGHLGCSLNLFFPTEQKFENGTRFQFLSSNPYHVTFFQQGCHHKVLTSVPPNSKSSVSIRIASDRSGMHHRMYDGRTLHKGQGLVLEFISQEMSVIAITHLSHASEIDSVDRKHAFQCCAV